jgi:predicted peptidase
VVAPQTEWSWLGDAGLQAIAIVNSLKSEFSVDERRLYVAGQSIGAAGAWFLPTRRPEMFAAAVVVAGAGDTSTAPAWAAIPVWVFHGDQDVVSNVNSARQMVSAVKQVGGSVRYTEISGAGHEIWQRTFTEPGLVDWLFAQSR